VASTAPLIVDYQERIVDVLADLGVSPSFALKAYQKIESSAAQGLHIHPACNFKVTRGGENYFFRALIRDDRQLRSMRKRTADVLRQIDQQLHRGKRAFKVPVVVASGESGLLVWDLETVVHGRHLPCAWHRPYQLRPWLSESRKQVRAFGAIEGMSLNVPLENWSKQNRESLRLIAWARNQTDFRDLPFDEVSDVQRQFHHSVNARAMSVIHPDLWQGNILTREGKVPVVLDWDEVHVGDPGEMYGRHWILMCSEPRWQEEIVTAIGQRSDQFWQAFHVYAWARAIDQIRYELTVFQSRSIKNYAELQTVSSKRAVVVDQMLKSLRTLARNVGGPPPGRGQGNRRFR
jgi:aminoglycoside phosphotransferase (APT) family kinase protein